MNNPRGVETTVPSPPAHWVGDGFPVSSIISPQTVQNRLSPFILMDYAGPAHFHCQTVVVWRRWNGLLSSGTSHGNRKAHQA